MGNFEGSSERKWVSVSHVVGWNVDTISGAGAAILRHERESVFWGELIRVVETWLLVVMKVYLAFYKGMSMVFLRGGSWGN